MFIRLNILHRKLAILLALIYIFAPDAQAGWLRRSVQAEVSADLAGTVVRQSAANAITMVEAAERRALIRKYIRDIEVKTGKTIASSQRARIFEAGNQRKFRELSQIDKLANKMQYIKNRKNMISDWETKNNKKWPVYMADVPSKSGKILYREAGDKYDLHHVIPKEQGGPNTWWNSHPASSPDEHQNWLHRIDGPLSFLQRLFGH